MPFRSSSAGACRLWLTSFDVGMVVRGLRVGRRRLSIIASKLATLSRCEIATVSGRVGRERLARRTEAMLRSCEEMTVRLGNAGRMRSTTSTPLIFGPDEPQGQSGRCNRMATILPPDYSGST